MSGYGREQPGVSVNRRRFLAAVSGVLAATPLAVSGKEAAVVAPVSRLAKSKDNWRALLSADRFDILFEEGTERPFSSALNKEKREGTYICAACLLPLFGSAQKYDSGTGWPSFWDPKPGSIATRRDFKLVLPRTEYHCARCGGHQGHVFDDGPRPTGLRYCNNGLAIQFVPANEPLPALRT
jgi:peptide-methionine (R)-S-oxide reductase